MPAWPGGPALAGWLLVIAVVLTYAGSLHGPFVFDDHGAIVDNPSIRELTAWPDVVWAPATATGASGRPVINLSLALNYALGGLDPFGYHLFNVAVHALAALVLFGLVRRTVAGRPGRERGEATPFALAVALLWALHPLLTESVTFVIQRTESLSGLIYLLALYCFMRGAEETGRRRWLVASVLTALVGMATKETMATLPVIVLFYDRAFVAGDFRTAWAKRKLYYAALAATWGFLAGLILANNGRAGVVGFGLGMSAWHYLLTQCHALVLYLKLCFWPHPLVVDYGAEVISRPAAVWWQGSVMLALAGATLVAVVRRPALGFLGLAFFALLAPSSSFVPLTTQTIAEHRMYLPLAIVVILVVGAAWRRWPGPTLVVSLVLAVVAAVATAQRNQDYRSAIGLWEVTVRDCPDNARARVNLGGLYAKARRWPEAIEQFTLALKVKPGYADAESNLGNALSEQGDYAAAIPHYQRALALKPAQAGSHYWLAHALMRVNRPAEALEHSAAASRLAPNDVRMLRSYAGMLAYQGRPVEALAQYEQAIRLAPRDGALGHETGLLLARLGRDQEAQTYLERAVASNPEQTSIRYALAMLLMRLANYPAAAQQFAILTRAQPDFADAYYGLAEALLAQERWDEAIAAFDQVLRLRPTMAGVAEDRERALLLRELRGAKKR